MNRTSLRGVTGGAFVSAGLLMIAIPPSPMGLLYAVASPFTAFVCFQKGKRVLAWLGAAALPGAVVAFMSAVALLRDTDSASGFAGPYIVLGVTIAAAACLSVPSVVGATRLALPGSAWALKRYGEDKTAAAHRRFQRA